MEIMLPFHMLSPWRLVMLLEEFTTDLSKAGERPLNKDCIVESDWEIVKAVCGAISYASPKYVRIHTYLASENYGGPTC